MNQKIGNVTLESLIKEQEGRKRLLKKNVLTHPCYGFYYSYEKSDEYQEWLAVASRYIGIHFPNDPSVAEFKKVKEEELSPEQQKKLLAILKSLNCLPTVIQSKDDNQNGLTIYNNINNSNNQSQSQEQSVAISIFLDAIKDELKEEQLKELRKVVNDSGDDKENAKNGIIDKLKSFGSDVATNIVANILTNPIIWSGL